LSAIIAPVWLVETLTREVTEMTKMIMLVTLAALFVGVQEVVAGDMPELRPRVRWLEGERLRGVLFHDPRIMPLRPRYIQAAEGKPPAKPQPVTVVGRSYFLLLPGKEGRIAAEVAAVGGPAPYPHSLCALFDENGKEIATAVIPAGKVKRVEAKGARGICTLLVNSGPASRSSARVTPLTAQWCLDGTSHSFYDNTPLHLHFLRELKLAGFNLAMIDFERLTEDFLTPQGLAEWTAKVKQWADYARRVGLRIMPAVDLGGSLAEVRAWEGCRPGLYLEHDPSIPLAPCPLDRKYWKQIYLIRGRAVAKLAVENPYVVGFGLDPEMYQCWKYGHYMLSGTCFCDHCLGGFLESKGLDRSILTTALTGKERYEWLRQQKLFDAYDKYLEDEMAKIAAWCRDELHALAPDFLTDMFVTEIGNWFCRGIARGFGKRGVPTLNFAEHTYYGVGYDPEWLTKIISAYRSWGAEVVQGSAIWDLFFPATEPRFFAAHAYNLITRGQGYWYWPGDDLYRSRGATFAYYGKPAWQDDFWVAAAWAHHEADLWLKNRQRVSELDRWEPVAWRGKFSKDGWQVPQEIINRCNIPAYPLHILTPATLYFRVSERTRNLTLTARTRHPGTSAAISLLNSQRQAAGELAVTDTEEAKLTVHDPAPGVWRIEITSREGASPSEVMLALNGPRPFLATAPEVLPTVLKKPPGLIGWWRLDEGKGTTIADSSPPPHFDGQTIGATWTQGVKGMALAFDGHSEAVVMLDEPFHHLDSFTLSAWVKLDSLSKPGNGRTILNKGPEAPVQHFWWWIGYPPDYPLILELGNEKHRWGTSFSSPPLQWELGRWYHVAVTFERRGNTCIVHHYRDGVLVGKSEKEDDLHSGSYDLRIGSYGGLHWMEGAIDEVRFYDTVLSPEQVAAEAAR